MVVWLAEECRLLEEKNLELRKELKAAHAATEHACALADVSKEDADRMRQAVHDTSVKQSTAVKSEERLLNTIASLQARIKELEAEKRKLAKERRSDAQLLDSIALKHSNMLAEAATEAKRHAVEEGKYTSLLTDFQAVTQREMETLRAELVASNRRRDELDGIVRTLERKAVDAREELTQTYAQLAESRDREQVGCSYAGACPRACSSGMQLHACPPHACPQALVLERESISQQLAELAKSYRHDMSDAEAQVREGVPG